MLHPSMSLPQPQEHRHEEGRDLTDSWHQMPWQPDGRMSGAARASSHAAQALGRQYGADSEARASFVNSLLTSTSQQIDGTARSSMMDGSRSLRLQRALPPLSPLTAAMAVGHEGRCARQDGWAVLDQLQTLNVRTLLWQMRDCGTGSRCFDACFRFDFSAFARNTSAQASLPVFLRCKLCSTLLACHPIVPIVFRCKLCSTFLVTRHKTACHESSRVHRCAVVQGSFGKSTSGLRNATSSVSREGGSMRSSCAGLRTPATKLATSSLHEFARGRSPSGAGNSRA